MATFRIQILDERFGEFVRAEKLQTVDRWCEWCARGTLVSESRSTRVSRYQLVDPTNEPLDIHVKHFRYALGRGRSVWPRDKARIEARNAELIRQHSPFLSTDVLAIVSIRRYARLTASWLVTRTVPNAVSLDAWLHSIKEKQREAVLVLRSLATGLAQMHAAGFVHIDLQARNILLSHADDIPTKRIFLIDSTRGGMRSDPIRLQHGCLRDLSALYKSLRPQLRPIDTLRLYIDYCGQSRLGDTDRLLLRTVLADRALKDNDAAP